MLDSQTTFALSLVALMVLVAALVGVACAHTTTSFAECTVVAGLFPAACARLLAPLAHPRTDHALISAGSILWIATVMLGFATGGGSL